VSPVAPVHPVAVVFPGVDVSAVLRVAAVAPVPAMRWFSFVHEGVYPAMEPNGLRRFCTPVLGDVDTEPCCQSRIWEKVRPQVLGSVESPQGRGRFEIYPRGNQKLARGPLRHPRPGRLASAPRLPTQVAEAWFASFCCSRFAATKVDPFQWFEKSWIELRHMVF
jgi:hypothetical protein